MFEFFSRNKRNMELETANAELEAERIELKLEIDQLSEELQKQKKMKEEAELSYIRILSLAVRMQAELAKTGNRQKIYESPYEVLGISEYYTEAELHRAWRKGVSLWHPDVVEHLNPSLEHIKKMVEEKFLKIREAYDELRRKFE